MKARSFNLIPATISKVKLLALLLILASGFAQFIHGQIEIRPLPERPENPRNGTWYFDQERGKVSVFTHQRWKSVKTFWCHNLIRFNNYYWLAGSKPVLADTVGNILTTCASEVYGDDSVLFVYGYPRNYAINLYGDTILHNLPTRHKFNSPEPRDKACVVQARRGYCFPLAPVQGHDASFWEWKSWGIIGVDGQWLIAPQYDGPFQFENGIAEVLYYGQKRKINEQGEFVE